ncbi:TonB-dependent receptor [Novosphingobium rosa]|uniref:TonB-dependent receptor n=1 Tax=Novosphingobium rosa TaxID=76978 RepID=UPI0014710EEB|nr:TonB-dependent receptor [Novosphingobium rosa]
MLAVTAIFAGPAMAEDAPAPQQAQQPGIQDIIVTANKREENINKVGLSITAVSGNDLKERKIVSLSDLASVVPGLSFAASNANTPIFTLRGVGFNDSSLGVYPAVSVYVDQAPLPFPVMASHAAFDLERVEVLKGPQGTLFGENATGGAINYIAAKPTKSLQAGGDISYGRFNSIDANAYISGPLTDTLGFRIAATGSHMDDWQYSISRPNDTNGHISFAAGRLLLDWKPTSAARFELSVNGYKDTSQPQAQQLILLNPQGKGASPALISRLLASPFAPNNARAANWVNQALDPATGVINADGSTQPGTASYSDFRQFSDRTFWQIALRGDIDLTPDITLTSMTSYDHFDQRQRVGGDGNDIVTFALQRNDGMIRTFNQELRLANSGHGALKWILGGNFERTVTDENQLLRIFDNTADNAGNLYINGSAVDNHQSITNWAIFGNAEYKLIDRLTLIGGVRYTDSHNSANVCGSTIPGGNDDKLFNYLGSLTGQSFTPINYAGCYTLNAINVPIPKGVTIISPYGPGPLGVPGEPFVAKLNESNVSWKAGINFQMTPRALLYGTVSKGYKSGSFPSLAAATFTPLLPVTQESVLAYELGAKLQSADHKLSLNSAAFYYDYRNKQVRGKLLDPIFGDLEAEVNVPKSRIWGLEADLTVREIPEITITGGVTYLNSRVLTYNGVDSVGNANQNFAGDPLPFTPKWSGSVDIGWRHELGNDAAIFAGTTVTARTKTDAVFNAQNLTTSRIQATNPLYLAGLGYAAAAPGVTQPFVIDGYATVDARAGYESGHGWRVMVWAKNLLNKYYWTNVISSTDSAARLAGMPATYGVTFGFTFK